jgi:hypothetical protein
VAIDQERMTNTLAKVDEKKRKKMIPGSVLAFLSHRIICKRTDVNCSLHSRVFQGIESTGSNSIISIE